MRGQKNVATAMRRPNGELSIVSEPLNTFYSGRARELPLIRGCIVLVETLVLGTRVLLHSANVSLEEEEEEITGPMVWGVITVSLILAIVLFLITPLFLVHYLDPHLGSSLISNIVEGIFRIGIFVAYLGAMNLLPDIRRVWAYHGAEHKTVNAYEDGAPLEVNSVKRYSTAHIRCGTGFLLAVLVIAIIVFAFLGCPEMWLRVLSRIVLIPVIAALGYEVTRLGAAYAHNRIIRTLLAPGMALQSMTTREPDDGQLEVAISALERVIEDDKENAGKFLEDSPAISQR